MSVFEITPSGLRQILFARDIYLSVILSDQFSLRAHSHSAMLFTIDGKKLAEIWRRSSGDLAQMCARLPPAIGNDYLDIIFLLRFTL